MRLIEIKEVKENINFYNIYKFIYLHFLLWITGKILKILLLIKLKFKNNNYGKYFIYNIGIYKIIGNISIK